MGNSFFNSRLGVTAIAAAAMFATPVLANDTLALLSSGYQLQIVPATGEAFTVKFSPDGTYQTTLGSSGTWRVEGDMLCTVRASDKISSCGVIPTGKKRGDAWATKDGNRKDVTVTILAPAKGDGG